MIVEPDQDVTGLKSIAEEITEELDYTPGKFFVRQYVRTKYVKPVTSDGVAENEIIIASLPSRPIDKCIAGAALLAYIIINKYIDHLPVYRQVQRFAREGMKLPASTITGWISQVCALLEVLYAVHCKLVFDVITYKVTKHPLRCSTKIRGPLRTVHPGGAPHTRDIFGFIVHR